MKIEFAKISYDETSLIFKINSIKLLYMKNITLSNFLSVNFEEELMHS